MTARRRRNLFPGVPAPGDRDPDVTHAYPGLADELRAEARREPAMLDLGQAGPAPEPFPATVDLGDGVQRSGTVTMTPLHDALRDDSRDLPPADVEAWQTGQQRGASVAPELAAALQREPEPAAGEDGLDEVVHPVWGGSPPFAPERAAAEPERRGVDLDEWAAEPQPDEGHRGPEWRRVIDSADEPVEVRLGCGCQIVVRSCTT